MEVSELGEFRLIEILADMVSRGRQGAKGKLAEGLVVDVGDDAAAWRSGEGTELATTDTVVEGVHFTRHTTPWDDLGWKLMAANVSDIASMGGEPLFAMVTLGVPGEMRVEDIQLLYQGMLEMSGEVGLAIVGGDVVRSPVVFVTVALNGVHPSSPMLRSTALPGDHLGVTGFLGSSAGGLELMLKGVEASPEAAAYLRRAHRRPEPCITQGKVLSEHGVKTAMDISDGLMDDLAKLCAASRVAAVIQVEAVPQHPSLKDTFGQRSLELAMGGGEDYQLLFAAPMDVMDQVIPLLGPPATVIGEIVEGDAGTVTAVDGSGRPLEGSYHGWDHFK